MVRTHPITPDERAQCAAFLLAHQGTYGVVTQMSRERGVSRPTLYAWREQAQQALRHTFTPAAPAVAPTPALTRQVLTLWSTHASVRGIQTALYTLTGQYHGLATINAILAEAALKALTWMHTHAPSSTRALALDEIYANDRRGAYLNVVDVHSGAVWASEGPLPVDTDSWTLVLWSLQDHGVQWDRLVADDGKAIRAATQRVSPECTLHLDQWHLLHACSKVQARLERWRERVEARTSVVERQAARLAKGQRARGRQPHTDVLQQAQAVAVAQCVTSGLRYLLGELHRLLDVVVLDGRGVLSASQRDADLEALLVLLNELALCAPEEARSELEHLNRRISSALPQLLCFVEGVECVQTELLAVLPKSVLSLLGWAFLRRRVLGWQREQIVGAIGAEWQAAAGVLVATWEEAVRVSSAVERWHSILRPHLAVRRTLTGGMLALLAVWHNHRVFRRGVHKGQSPLHLSGIADAPSDWLVALGYPPLSEREPGQPLPALAA